MKTDELNYLWAAIAINEFYNNGVNYFCLSLGSRSTPLAVALAKNNKVTVKIFHDERSAAFHAVGYAKATNTPAAVICTSGTAAANYYPAVIEAFYSNTPMIIISADRPPELKQCGANQTINQTNLFNKYTCWSFEVPSPTNEIDKKFIPSLVDQAVFKTISNSLPVHLNFMFREPLLPNPTLLNTISRELEIGFYNQPMVKFNKQKSTINRNKIEEIKSIINSSKNGLFIIGELRNKADIDSVIKFVNGTEWFIITDILSSIRFYKNLKNTIDDYESNIEKITEILNNIETVIKIGTPIISTKINSFIETSSSIKNKIVITDKCEYSNYSHTECSYYKTDIAILCNELSEKVHKKENSLKLIANYTTNKPLERILSERYVSVAISKFIDSNGALFLSNSIPIRSMNMHALRIHENIIYTAANRGASGIDGIISTSIGYATGIKKRTTLIIGDIAFLHDCNSLSTLDRSLASLTIVVINNHGGQIFSKLPINEHSGIVEKYFIAPPNYSIEFMSKAFFLDYTKVSSCDEFDEVYKKTQKNKAITVIEIECVK